MAQQDHAEVLLESIQLLIDKSLGNFKTDSTEVCTILAKPSNTSQPYEVTLDGITIIEAYAEELKYDMGDEVLVFFSKDDTKRKIILSEYSRNILDQVEVIRPSEQFVAVNTLLLPPDDKGLVISQNGLTDFEEKAHWGRGYFDSYALDTCNAIYVKCTVTTENLNTSGEYALYVNVGTNNADYDFAFELSSKNMLGNPYKYDEGFVQEILYHYTLPEGIRIEDIELYGYRDDVTESGGTVTFSDVTVGLGYDMRNLDSNRVIITSNESPYYNVNAGDHEKKLQLYFFNKTNSDEYIGFEGAEWSSEKAQLKRGVVVSISEGKAMLQGVSHLFDIPNEITDLAVGDLVTYTGTSDDNSLVQKYTMQGKVERDENYYYIEWSQDDEFGVLKVQEPKKAEPGNTSSGTEQEPKNTKFTAKGQATLEKTRVTVTVWYNGESYAPAEPYLLINEAAINKALIDIANIHLEIQHGINSKPSYPFYEASTLTLPASEKAKPREVQFSYTSSANIAPSFWDGADITWTCEGLMLLGEKVQNKLYVYDQKNDTIATYETKKDDTGNIITTWTKKSDNKDITDFVNTPEEGLVSGVSYCLRNVAEVEGVKYYEVLGPSSSMVKISDTTLVNAKYKYQIAERYNPGAVNNKIKCEVCVDTEAGPGVANDDIDFAFSTFGSSGTDYTIVFGEEDKMMTVQVVDKEGNAVEPSIWQYAWSTPDNWTTLKAEEKTGKYLIDISDCTPARHNLLHVQARIDWNGQPTWVRSYYGVQTPLSEDSVEYLAQVPYSVIYDSTNTNPSWEKGPLKLYTIDEEGFASNKPLDNIEWRVHTYKKIDSRYISWKKIASNSANTETYQAIVPVAEEWLVIYTSQSNDEELVKINNAPANTLVEYTVKEGEAIGVTVLEEKNTGAWRTRLTIDCYNIEDIISDFSIVTETDEQGNIITQSLQVPPLLLNNNSTVALEAYNEHRELLLNIPIYIGINPYQYDLLNNWDGALNVDNEGNYVLASMLGAGRKESDNTFTGVIMGERGKLDSNSGIVTDKETGLFGFWQGQQTFEFNTNGTATLGAAGAGQIVFDGNNGYIQSREYTKKDPDAVYADSGMRIDLNQGTINSKSFNLDKDGNLRIKGHIESESGSIGGWNIDENKLYYEEDYDQGKRIAGIQVPKDIATVNVLAIGDIPADSTEPGWNGAPFRVTKEGVLYATGAKITGEITATSGKIGGWQINSGTWDANNKNTMHGSLTFGNPGAANSIGLYTWYNNDVGAVVIGGSKEAKSDWRFTIGPNFGVDKAGTLYATGVNITGNITATTLSVGSGNQQLTYENGTLTVQGNITASSVAADNITAGTLKTTVKCKTLDAASGTIGQWTAGEHMGFTGFYTNQGITVDGAQASVMLHAKQGIGIYHNGHWEWKSWPQLVRT